MEFQLFLFKFKNRHVPVIHPVLYSCGNREGDTAAVWRNGFLYYKHPWYTTGNNTSKTVTKSRWITILQINIYIGKLIRLPLCQESPYSVGTNAPCSFRCQHRQPFPTQNSYIKSSCWPLFILVPQPHISYICWYWATSADPWSWRPLWENWQLANEEHHKQRRLVTVVCILSGSRRSDCHIYVSHWTFRFLEIEQRLHKNPW